ncbi:immunoglobulin domain-containing protein [Mesoterricola silvestris]|uniref:Ig-like domain-containing protein n=1 Tax=Mesoterricola silvestris TaxID=2927979 RepID=A0AA48KA75_9BACT|nr:immunoglobulin domain-containing protein [Mesoterricola silvestris]BDU71243.1 hypothetical protein METEAL_04170 [Mesoterricola silvestris]
MNIKLTVGLPCALLLGSLVHCGGGRSGAETSSLAPLVTSQPQDQAVKAPASATFYATASGDPAPTYQWALNGVPIPGATSNAFTTAGTDSSMTGQVYTLTATNSLGSATSAGAALTVTGPPVITTQPASATVRLGDTGTFSVAAAGLGGLTYEWSRNGSTLEGVTGPTCSVPAVSPDLTGGSYTVKVTSPSGSATSNPAILTVAYGPVIAVQPASRGVKAPDPVEFKVEAKGNPVVFQWFRNGIALAGANEATWSVPVTTVAMNGDVYQVEVTCADVSLWSDKAILNVSGAPVITAQPRGVSLLAGSAFSLTVEAVGVPEALTYQWNKDGDPIPGATAPTFAVAQAAVGDAGSYSVTVSNAAGSTESLKAKVAVTAGYTVGGTVTAGGEPVAGAILTLGTSPVRTATNDAFGAFAFAGVLPGTYVLTPSIPAFSAVISPASHTLTVPDDGKASFTAVLGYTVSGTLTGAGAGTTYLSLQPAGGGTPQGAAHLDLGGGSGFTFRGVPPGTYTLTGRTDLYDKGVPNAHDPAGTLAAPVTVRGGDVAGLVLALAAGAPDLSLLPAPAFTASGMDSGIVLDYAPVTSAGVEQPQFYQVDWSTDPEFATLSGTRRLSPSAGHLLILTGGLPADGTVYHVRMRGVGPATATPWSPPASVPVGPASGLLSASGTVSFATPPTGPLVVGLRDLASGRAWMTRLPSPVSPQPFSISGIPPSSPGSYQLIAFLDQDANGVPSFGDAVRTQTVAMDQDLPGLAPVLPSAACTAQVATRHSRPGGTDAYALAFTLKDGIRHVASAQVVSGPNLPVPASLGTNGGSSVLTYEAAVTARPAVGDTYTILATYQDGTTGTLTTQVTGVLDLFPSLDAPMGTGDGSGSSADLQPAFAWTGTFPPAFHLAFSLTGPGVSWGVPALPPTTTSLDWSVDPGDPANRVTGSLAVGTPCAWTLAVTDDSGNASQVTAAYTP